LAIVLLGEYVIGVASNLTCRLETLLTDSSIFRDFVLQEVKMAERAMAHADIVSAHIKNVVRGAVLKDSYTVRISPHRRVL
jgi:hypothetical protein